MKINLHLHEKTFAAAEEISNKIVKHTYLQTIQRNMKTLKAKFHKFQIFWNFYMNRKKNSKIFLINNLFKNYFKI